MHEITFSTDDKPKLLSQVYDSFCNENIVYVRTILLLNHVAEIRKALLPVHLLLNHVIDGWDCIWLSWNLHIITLEHTQPNLIRTDFEPYVITEYLTGLVPSAVNCFTCWNWTEHPRGACLLHNRRLLIRRVCCWRMALWGMLIIICYKLILMDTWYCNHIHKHQLINRTGWKLFLSYHGLLYYVTIFHHFHFLYYCLRLVKV